jgi:hypothetical protein
MILQLERVISQSTPLFYNARIPWMDGAPRKEFRGTLAPRTFNLRLPMRMLAF